MLGYTSATWDNLSGEELQPWSTIKSWVDLTANEQIAAGVLGYNETTWTNVSGTESQPLSSYKYWNELTDCNGGEIFKTQARALVCIFRYSFSLSEIVPAHSDTLISRNCFP